MTPEQEIQQLRQSVSDHVAHQTAYSIVNDDPQAHVLQAGMVSHMAQLLRYVSDEVFDRPQEAEWTDDPYLIQHGLLADRSGAEPREPRCIHDLKCQQSFFQKIWDGDKTFEIRKNDRDYREADVLRLNEVKGLGDCYTGRKIWARVVYLTDFEQRPGYVVMGISVLAKVQRRDIC